MDQKVTEHSNLQDSLPFVGLLPSDLPSGWTVNDLSIRPEGSKWSTLWYEVHTPAARFRVKQFFQDNMEPTFPDTCILGARGDCFQKDGLTYWRGMNYKGCDSYVLSLWKTQVEISIDRGALEQPEMEAFLRSLQPVDPSAAKEILRKPFHELSFHARTGRGQGEVSGCSRWMAPEKANLVPLSAELPAHWVLESVGIGRDEEQFVYWDPNAQVYALWANRHKNRSYHPSSSWTRNYSPKTRLKDCEVYAHPARGTVIYQEANGTQTAYVFRGAPATTPEQVTSFFGLS